MSKSRNEDWMFYHYDRRRNNVREQAKGAAVIILWIGMLIFLAISLISTAVEAASVQRYDNASYLTRALLECEIPEVANDGWCDTAVDAPSEFRGELYWSSWGATIAVHVCWLGTDQGCIDTQSELLFRYVAVGEDGVATYIRSFDLYDIADSDLYHHILFWTIADQQLVGTLPDGRRYILTFEAADANEKAYLWSD